MNIHHLRLGLRLLRVESWSPVCSYVYHVRRFEVLSGRMKGTYVAGETATLAHTLGLVSLCGVGHNTPVQTSQRLRRNKGKQDLSAPQSTDNCFIYCVYELGSIKAVPLAPVRASALQNERAIMGVYCIAFFVTTIFTHRSR